MAYERIIEIDPFDVVPHAALGRLALDSGEIEKAVQEFRVALAAGPVDVVVAHCDLAESLILVGKWTKRNAMRLLRLRSLPHMNEARNYCSAQWERCHKRETITGRGEFQLRGADIIRGGSAGASRNYRTAANCTCP